MLMFTCILCGSSRNDLSHPVSIFYAQTRVSLFFSLSRSSMHKHVFPSFSFSPSCSLRGSEWSSKNRKKKGVVSKQEISVTSEKLIETSDHPWNKKNCQDNGARMFGTKFARLDSFIKQASRLKASAFVLTTCPTAAMSSPRSRRVAARPHLELSNKSYKLG
jgi:GTP cyclohydrolase FolE2